MKGAFTRASIRARLTAPQARPQLAPRHTKPYAISQGEPWRRGVHGTESKHCPPTEIKTAWNPRNLLRHNKRSFRPTPDNSERKRRIAHSLA